MLGKVAPADLYQRYHDFYLHDIKTFIRYRDVFMAWLTSGSQAISYSKKIK